MRILTVLALAAMLVVCIQPAQAEGLSFYGGLGFAKWLEDGAPDGSLGITAGVMFPLDKLSVGAEVGFLMLGSDEYDDCWDDDDWDDLKGFDLDIDCGKAKDSYSLIPITAQVWYEIPTAGSLTPMLTGGLGFYMSRVKMEIGKQSRSHSETDFGINFGGGLKFGAPDAAIKFGADARFHLILTEDESTKLLTVMARVFF